MRTVLPAILTVLCLSPAAWAEVGVEYRAAGGTSVDVILTATGAGQVEIPAGTIIATGLESEQRFMIGGTIERTLQAGERATVSVHAYCLDLDRSAPSAGSVMSTVGVATGDLRRLLQVAGDSDHRLLQDAIWAAGSVNMTPSPEVVALLLRAGLRPKVETTDTE